MRVRAFLLFALAVLAFSSVAQCAVTLDGTSTPLTPEHSVKYRRISDLHFSADGSSAVCVVSEFNGPTVESHLWAVDFDKLELRPLIVSPKSERSPQWAPRGDSLAFLSKRDGPTQVYVLPHAGGEPYAVTASTTGVSEFRWSPDGNHIAYRAREPELEKSENAPRIADREQDLERLWVVDLASHAVRQVTRGAWRIDEFDWVGPDQILAIASDKPRAESWNSALYKIAVDDGSIALFSKANQPFSGLRVSPTRTEFSYVSTRGSGPIPHDLYIQPLSGGPARDVTSAVDRAVLSARWQNDSATLVRVADGFQNRIFRIDSHGVALRIDLPYSVRDFDVAADGTLLFVGVGFNHLPELFVRRMDGTVAQIGHLQKGWGDTQLADAKIIHVKSFDGTDIEAALMKPVAPTSHGKFPLVLLVHGGPADNFSADYFWFNSWAQLLVVEGYEVLMVNPRGSIGYGETFLKANRGDWGGGDFKDLMAAVDKVIALGETDPNRLGIGGWSYGGEMTQWAIGHTNRFKAAVTGGGVFDQAAEFETEDSPADDEWYFGTPWAHPDVFARNSPSRYIRNATTPTLIVHGEVDRNNPVGQSQALYRALKHFGVESQLITYPGEPHLPRQEQHQVDILRRMLEWFDRYLKKSG